MKLVSIIFLLSTFYLASCIPIRVVPKYNPDIYNGYKVIQGFQKKEMIGNTNTIQREKDLKSCGVMNFRDGYLDLNVVYPNTTFDQTDERSKLVYNCMKRKGYIIYSPESCTLKGKPTGFCN